MGKNMGSSQKMYKKCLTKYEHFTDKKIYATNWE